MSWRKAENKKKGMDKMEDIREQVEDVPKHLGLVVSLDDIDKNVLSGWKREEFTEIVSDLKKIGIQLKIDTGHLVLSYRKGKEEIINWDDYPVRVTEEQVRNVNMKGADNMEQEMNRDEVHEALKYELTGETRIFHDEVENKDYTLHRIVATKDFILTNGEKISVGDLGGFVESEENLSQDGTCWVGGGVHWWSAAYGNAKVSDNAYIEYAGISGNAKVCENAIVLGAAGIEIRDNAVITGNAKVIQHMDEETVICDNAEIGGNAKIVDSKIGGNCIVEDIEIIGGRFCENIKISEEQMDSPFLYGDIENLRSEIVKLEDSPKELPMSLVREKLQEKYTELHKQTELAFKSAEMERREHPKFLQSINLDKINDVYIHKNYSGGWLACVHMNDFIKMKEKKGLNALEFKYCDISSVLFNEKFKNCKFERCSLFGCTLENTEFVNTTFKNVTFYNSTLQNVKFENCIFENCKNFDSSHQMEESVNIEFVNTDIKDSRIAFDRTNIDLKSVCLKNCSIENLEFSINKANVDFPTHCQLITKNVKEQSLRKLMDRNIRKSIKQRDDAAMPKKKQKKAKCR